MAKRSSLHEVNLKFPKPVLTYSELTIETLEQGVKYVQNKQERHQK